MQNIVSRYTHAKLLQLCLTLCDPMDCSLSGSSVHGILQARILEWVAIPFSVFQEVVNIKNIIEIFTSFCVLSLCNPVCTSTAYLN